MLGKPELKPPTTPRPFSPDPRASRLKVITLIAFLALAIVAVGVVVVLPQRLAQQQSTGRVVAAISASASANEQSVADLKSHQHKAQSQAEAERLLKEALRLQSKLEMEGVKVWGSQLLVTSYPDALEKLAEADAHFNAQRFDLSANVYLETIGMLEQLASSRPERIQRALQAGKNALEQLNSETAIRQFKITLAMDPANREAQQGLQRARNLPPAMELMREAKLAEDNGELDRARNIYREALLLDADFHAARESLVRVDKLILTRDYQRAVSDALTALQDNNYSAARRALDSARLLKPTAAEIHDIDQRLRASKRMAELDRLSSQALRFEQKEQWQKAAQTYSRALNIDAHASFALSGKLRSKKFSKLNKEIDDFLATPDVLQAPESLAKARETHDTLTTISDMGPKLREKQVKLGQLIDAYSRLFPVVLMSDNMTDVRIYRVGRYGQFIEQRLKLRPGRYTAHGTRSGYRDVRILFHVPVSGMQTTVMVQCEETI